MPNNPQTTKEGGGGGYMGDISLHYKKDTGGAGGGASVGPTSPKITNGILPNTANKQEQPDLMRSTSVPTQTTEYYLSSARKYIEESKRLNKKSNALNKKSNMIIKISVFFVFMAVISVIAAIEKLFT